MAKEDKRTGTLFSKLLSWLPSKQRGGKQTNAADKRKSSITELKLAFFIVDWDHAAAVSGVFEGRNAGFNFICRGRGTASSEILDLLGIGRSDKAVIISLEQPRAIPALFKEVRKKINFHSPGGGIAFSVPLSGINSPVLRVFENINKKNPGAFSTGETERRWIGPDRRQSGQRDEPRYALIVSVIKQGYSDEFMNAAREAGARGGTIINARGQSHEGTVKFFGISVQSEKEVIIILAANDKKLPIMEAVNKACGADTKAEGLIVSLPVDKIKGVD